MKDLNIHNNNLFRNLFKNSELKVPFSDLEEDIMQRIQKETVHKKVLSGDRKLSFFFFIAGTVLGIVLNSFLQKIRSAFPSIPADTAILVFQLGFALFFLIKLEGFLKLFTRIKKAA